MTSERFKTALADKGWSIAQLARRIGEFRPRVSTAINHPEAGAYRIQQKAAKALGISYDGPKPKKRKPKREEV